MVRETTITLKDGRYLGYTQYGDPEGFPVFLFHGTPGSRLLGLDDDTVAVSLGVCLITTDRPGYGLSDAKPDREKRLLKNMTFSNKLVFFLSKYAPVLAHFILSSLKS